jgi:hypothetical protein
MANNYSPVPRFNAGTKYFDSNTPSGLTTPGYQQFAALQEAQGVIPIVSEPPTVPISQAQAPSNGAIVFNPNTNTLHVYNAQESAWKATVLA